MTARPHPDRRLVRGFVRRVAEVVAPPQALAFWADRLAPGLDPGRARVLERRPESADAATLVLQPGRGWGGFRPGQHVGIGAEIDGRRVRRSYSPTGIPRADGRISITVKRVAGGKLSGFLCKEVPVGAWLDIGPAFGGMTLPANPDAPLLFLAAGSGITPLVSMTRALAAGGMPAPLTLLYWVRRRDELCFVDELRGLARDVPGFEVRFLLTGDAASADDESEGRIDAMQLARDVPDLAGRRVLACGPDDFVEAARALTASQAIAFDSEAFTASRIADDSDTSGNVQVTLAASQRVLTVPRGSSLLEALETAGLSPAHGCRMGICNTCACGKRSGSTRHLHTGALEHEPATALRLCVHRAASDLVLDL
ncbi:MAG TPA: ferredoxin reductase [Thermomonas sp.]|nr:ferredoxin reductase [Thermomonas sp.]